MNGISKRLKILSIDIGGTRIKATVLSTEGACVTSYFTALTPHPASPENVLDTICSLAQNFTAYDHISVGFPGFVKEGVIKTAPNLGTQIWYNFNLAEALQSILGYPAKVLNDADMQGLGICTGYGVELLITLGTGLGTALLSDGSLLHHLEFAHQPYAHHKSYDDYIGAAALQEVGIENWNARMSEVLTVIKEVYNYDQLYIGGGNASNLRIELENDMKIVSNADGIRGGARLWTRHYNKIRTTLTK
jgi:polyphosphate glucokinase